MLPNFIKNRYFNSKIEIPNLEMWQIWNRPTCQKKKITLTNKMVVGRFLDNQTVIELYL